jgi:hypothetical protein
MYSPPDTKLSNFVQDINSKHLGLDKMDIHQMDDYINNNLNNKELLSKFTTLFIIPALQKNIPGILEKYASIIDVNDKYYGNLNYNSYQLPTAMYTNRNNYRRKSLLINYLVYNNIQDYTGSYGQGTPLYYKSPIPEAQIICLLQHDLNPNSILLEGISLLQYAIIKESVTLLKTLLQFGADPNLQTETCENLVEFAFNYRISLIDFIFEIPDLQWSITENMLYNHQTILLKYNCFEKQPNIVFDRSILYNVTTKCCLEILEKLLNKFPPNMFGQYNFHKLCMAGNCYKSVEAKVMLLLKYSFNINELDDNGDTCIMYYLQTCYKSSKDIDLNFIKFLVSNGCTIHTVNKKGENLLYHIKAGFDKDIKALEYFILQGINININDGDLLIHWQKSPKKSQILLDSGIVVNSKNKVYADLLKVDNLMSTVDLSNQINLTNTNIKHITFFIENIKKMEAEMAELSTKQYFILDKGYTTYHKYWKECYAFCTYNIRCANILYKLYELIYTNMADLSEFTNYIHDSSVLWGVFIAKIDACTKPNKWININVIAEKHDIIDVAVILDKVRNCKKKLMCDTSKALDYKLDMSMSVCGIRRRSNDGLSDMGMCFI